MADRAHLSIGEVLSLLQDEFPDVTISKIRFLESQGLLDPERTPSGYRKFYEADIERLRWILRQQREHFLPLKVIKDRLGRRAPMPDARRTARRRGRWPTGAGAAERARGAPSADAGDAAPRRAAADPDAGGRPGQRRCRRSRTRRSACTARASSAPADAASTADELAELERYGLLAGRSVGGTTLLRRGRARRRRPGRRLPALRRRGPPPAHVQGGGRARGRLLRAGRHAAAQAAQPRAPAARRSTRSASWRALGQSLRAAMLRQALRDYLGRADRRPAVLIAGRRAAAGGRSRRRPRELSAAYADGVVLVARAEGQRALPRRPRPAR